MRIVTENQLDEWSGQYPDAARWLAAWKVAARGAQWNSIQEVRSQFRTADAVKVGSGRIVTVFNVAGNKYRLITAIHYNTKVVFTMLFLSHAEYSRDRWKETL